MLIAQLTDLHIRPNGRTANRVVESNIMAEKAFRAVQSLRPAPDVVLLTGDLVDTGMSQEYEMLGKLIKRHLNVPVFAIPGNHDHRERFLQYLHPYTRVASDAPFVQYCIDDFPLRMIMLDTVVSGKHHGELGPERLRFLDENLMAQPDRPTLIAMHHHPFHSAIEHLDHYQLMDFEAFAEIIGRHPQVAQVICGHTHRAMVSRVANTTVTTAPSTAHQIELDLSPDAPSGFMLEPPAFQLHVWHSGRNMVTHTALVDRYPGLFPYYKEPGYFDA